MIRRELLIKGESLKFSSGLEFKHPTVEDIINIGYDLYSFFAFCFILKPQDMIVPLWGQGIYYEDITKDELLIMQAKKEKETFLSMFKIATNVDDAWFEFVEDMEQETIFFKLKEKKYYFGFDTFDSIYLYYKNLFSFTHGEKRFFIGEKTKKSILDEDYQEYLNEQKSNKNRNLFSDMVSFVVIENKRKWEDIYNYPIARLYEEYIKTMKKRSSDYKMYGIYNGTVDQKKISDKEINWFIT